ncbi:uncharacterized protein N7483_002516 [Penicillium malachiteum]|uniref:uncharacterized protein n=1 Tax=Penicillium malachiteum TaxID=1324776 RepID=UPI00254771AC|nr:uncharacterized protein N7483_002516 [Penicillium malachiteum]KAJ5737391.1 hypothetical protein N7483_002516 [Penicillium malachiteum]
MDRHKRPYKCDKPEYDNVQGLTYCGDLTCHRREVHKITDAKTIDVKNTPICPYNDCDRNIRKPFTRRENLREHIRRLHQSAVDLRSSIPVGMHLERTNSPLTTRPKRKIDLLRSDVLDEVERLRQEIEKKDHRLEELQRMADGLHQLLSRPTQSTPEARPITQSLPVFQATTPQLKANGQCP